MTEAYPLKWPDGWPRARGREWGRFARNLDTDRTLDQLMDELRRLGATNIVISTNLKPRNVSARPDADPRADPGVAIYFTYNAKSMSMAQDRFDNVGKNARSLTLAIDAMRAIERHGGGYMMQRSFDGFAALPPPSDGKGYEKRPWRSVLELSETVYGALPKANQLILAEAAYRQTSRAAHPDVPGGSAERMAELNVAIEDARTELKDR